MLAIACKSLVRHEVHMCAVFARRSTCGLNEYVVKLAPLLHQRLKRLNHLCLHATAEAAIAELNPLLQCKILCRLHPQHAKISTLIIMMHSGHWSDLQI